jgi:membrane protein YdbS with pleckstrin-like domain
MKKLPEQGVVYKISRRAYFWNYILIALVLVLFAILSPMAKNFSLLPKTIEQFTSTIFVFVFIIAITFLIEEPTFERWVRYYIVKNNEIIKMEGILTKKRISIPYQSVADIKLDKGIVGRIFNFGDVLVVGLGNLVIEMKGMANPEVVFNVIQNKVSLMRGAVIGEKEKNRK